MTKSVYQINVIAALGIGFVTIIATIEKSLIPTLLTYLIILVAGLAACKKVEAEYNFQKIKSLRLAWLLKIYFSLFLLYWGWMPELYQLNSSDWGYDPQRYYFQAHELIENDWTPDFTSLNYFGILYYYAIIYKLIGFNPIVPALVNMFVTLLATLQIIKFCAKNKLVASEKLWRAAVIILVPEVLWYDILTSRETLVAALLINAEIFFGNYFLNSNNKVKLTEWVEFFACVVMIVAVRTSMIIPLIMSFILMAIAFGGYEKTGKYKIIFYIALSILLIYVSSLASELFGGYGFNVFEILTSFANSSDNLATDLDNWTDNSIGKLLFPNNLFQAILYIIPRALIYLIAPLPTIGFDIEKMISGSWVAWQALLTALTSILNLLLIPYVVSLLTYTIKTRRINAPLLILNVAFLSNILVIAGGNLIIHERYRLMTIVLFYALAWISYENATLIKHRKTQFKYYLLLIVCAIFYGIYKSR